MEKSKETQKKIKEIFENIQVATNQLYDESNDLRENMSLTVKDSKPDASKSRGAKDGIKDENDFADQETH